LREKIARVEYCAPSFIALGNITGRVSSYHSDSQKNSQNLQHSIFYFFRTDPSRSNVEGSGLGLAIAKWIAEMHHAELSVVSAEHKGTTFQVVFPLCET